MKTMLPFLLLLISFSGFSQQTGPQANYKLIKADSYVQTKNYYLLTLFDQLPEVKTLLKNDKVLAGLSSTKREHIGSAIKTCANDVQCYTGALKFSDQEISAVGGRLRELYTSNNALGKLVTQHLIPSGCYQLFANLGPQAMLVKAWEQDARAVNHTISVYAGGQPPKSARIDSISFNIRQSGYTDMLALNASLSVNETKAQNLFYSSTLVFALHSLEINERNQAADDEPMQNGVNKMALDYAKTIKWDQYKYSLILVPGEGPEEAGVALSAGGMLRCRLAVLQYRNGVAPLIMVSGGCVHPFKTKYNEAIEMKKYLIETLHIPEKAILVEPHARHTTTNLRNCARIIFRSGLPMDKPCITSTSRSQSSYITGVMAARCRDELGYMPFKNGKRLSDTEAEFYPLVIALQVDDDEPMDP